MFGMASGVNLRFACVDFMSFVFSVRINERTVTGVDSHDNKKLAYLVDLKTVEIGKFRFNFQALP